MRRIAVVGSRSFADYEHLRRVLQAWLPAEIISGGAQGADTLAQRLAQEENLPITVIKPDWRQFGRAAGPIRNRAIVDASDMVVAFWDGQSRGTASTLEYARAKNIPVLVELVDRNDP